MGVHVTGPYEGQIKPPLEVVVVSLKEFFLEHGTPEKTIDTLLRDISDDVKGDKAREIPLVSYSIETNLNSPAYGSINFTGCFAAMLEHSV